MGVSKNNCYGQSVKLSNTDNSETEATFFSDNYTHVFFDVLIFHTRKQNTKIYIILKQSTQIPHTDRFHIPFFHI